MSARILLQNDGSAGVTHWIEKPVIRIGSDPKSDIVIPSTAVASHALTVEFRQTGYRVYNRSSAQIFLGSRILDPGQHTSWLDTDLLELADGVSLALEADDDPTPSPKPIGRPAPHHSDKHSTAPVLPDQNLGETRVTDSQVVVGPSARPEVDQAERRVTHDESTAASSPHEKSSTGGNTILQLAVIGLCLLGSVGLLVRHQLKRPPSKDANAPSFGQLVQQARQPGGEISADLLDQLQLAEAALVRGQRDLAHRRYQELYDQLVRQGIANPNTTARDSSEQAIINSATSQQTSPPLQQLYQLVRYRLAAMK